MPSFNDRRVVATALDAGAHALENELGKTREDILYLLAESIQRESETIKFWLRDAKIPASIDDGSFYGFIWIVLTSTKLGDGWVRFVLSETSEPIRPETPAYLAREQLRALLRKASLGVNKHTLPDEQISIVIERIYPNETCSADYPANLVTSTDAPRLRQFANSAPIWKRWGTKSLLLLIPLLIAGIIFYPLPPRGCTDNASRTVSGPEAIVVFSRNILLRNFYQYPFYIYFKDELVQPQYLNLSANQSIFDGWRYRITSEFQELLSRT